MKRFLKIVSLLIVTLFFSQGCTAVLGNLFSDYGDIREKVKGSIELRYQSVIRHRIKGEEAYSRVMNSLMTYGDALAANGQMAEAWKVYGAAFAFHDFTEPSMIDGYIKYRRLLQNIDNPDFKLPDIKEFPKLNLPSKVPPLIKLAPPKPKPKTKKCVVCKKG